MRVGTGDFRAELYRQYVSAFKGPPPAAESNFAWWDHKVLPLLRDLDPAAPILDLGCGSGALLAYLGRRGFARAMGIDGSAEQVQLARSRGVAAQQADAFAFLDGRADAFEAILAFDVLEHFERQELLRLVPLLQRALRGGGRLVIQTANGAGLFPGQVIHGDLTHMTIFTPESLAQLLRPFGFGDLAFYETGPVPIRLRGRLDVALWRTIVALASLARRIETGKRQAIWTETFLCLARRRP